MRDLHAELAALRVEWPETPDLTGAVTARLATAPPKARRRARRARVFARPALTFAAALLLLTGTAVAAIPGARAAVLDALGLRGARIERGPVTPAPVPRSGLGDDLDLGRPISPDDPLPAPLRLRAPASLGAPDAVYLDLRAPGPRVSYLYRVRPGIPRADETGVAVLITVLGGTLDPAVQKTIGRGVRAERFEIEGEPALRLSGTPHGFGYTAVNGEFVFEQQRLATTTLLAQRGELLVRIEGRVPRPRAVALARELNPG